MSDNDKIKSHLRQIKEQFGESLVYYKGHIINIGELMDSKIAKVDAELEAMYAKEELHGSRKDSQ